LARAWNSRLETLLDETERVMSPRRPIAANNAPAARQVRVGVDLGTAYTVVLALDEANRPLAGAFRFAEVVRDGLVVDFVGAIDLLRDLKREVERQLGSSLTHAATGYPPGVPRAEIRATANVLNAAGLDCTNEVDEPTAANLVLQIDEGAVVDVGGGTTGIAVIHHGKVVYTADEATGGTHFSLVIAGALNLSLERAEQLKTNPKEQARLYPLVEPTMEKVATIVDRHIARRDVDVIYLVGGTSMFPGIGAVVERITGVKTIVPPRPLFITPLGIAMSDRLS
jgi:ethanolamine utilization protein EutJ